MTDNEFSKLAMFIKGLYPKEKDLFNDDSTSEIWYAMLSDLDFQTAVNAVKKHAVKSQYSPSIAEIRGSFDKEKADNWQQLYEHSMKIIARYGIYNEQGGMDALDDISREIVSRIGYRRICNSDEHDPYIRNEFRETWKDVSEYSGCLQLSGVDMKCLTQK
ncbi:MAG: hypothetical protein K6G68_11760 [Oscillospiraceae bacterium]|nr:hypothetical protein [Oscillospiraceae bacterium]